MLDYDGFARAFAQFWTAPAPDGLPSLLTDDVRLVHPMARPAVGIDAAKSWLARILAILPDLRAEVDRWSGTGLHLFVEFHLLATVGRRPVTWPVVDRFTLADDNRASERISYYDPTPLLRAGLTSPRGWLQLARAAL